MAHIQLEDVVLLGCEFEMWPQRSEPDESADSSNTEGGASAAVPDAYPTENILRWRATSRRDADELHLYLDGLLDDPRLPFTLRFDVGARYSTEDEDLDAERAQPTLLWLVYPYLRELVSNVTGRSPLEPYYLPPLTRLPDPSLGQD